MSTDTVSPAEPSLADFDTESTRPDGPECVAATARRVMEPIFVDHPRVDGVSVVGTPMRRHRTPHDLAKATRGVAPTGSTIAADGTRILASKAPGTTSVTRDRPTPVDDDRENNSLTDGLETRHHDGERFGDGGSAVVTTCPSFRDNRSAFIEGDADPKPVPTAVVGGP